MFLPSGLTLQSTFGALGEIQGLGERNQEVWPGVEAPVGTTETVVVMETASVSVIRGLPPIVTQHWGHRASSGHGIRNGAGAGGGLWETPEKGVREGALGASVGGAAGGENTPGWASGRNSQTPKRGFGGVGAPPHIVRGGARKCPQS